jgi:hypothetical protein
LQLAQREAPTIQLLWKNQTCTNWRNCDSGSRTAGFETDGVIHYIPEALLSAQILLCDFNGNVAHIPARQESESSASEMDAPSFPQLSIKKAPASVNFSPVILNI